MLKNQQKMEQSGEKNEKQENRSDHTWLVSPWVWYTQLLPLFPLFYFLLLLSQNGFFKTTTYPLLSQSLLPQKPCFSPNRPSLLHLILAQHLSILSIFSQNPPFSRNLAAQAHSQWPLNPFGMLHMLVAPRKIHCSQAPPKMWSKYTLKIT